MIIAINIIRCGMSKNEKIENQLIAFQNSTEETFDTELEKLRDYTKEKVSSGSGR